MNAILKLFLCLCYIVTWAQTNYQTGDLKDCYTWAKLADSYTKLEDVRIINNSTIYCSSNESLNPIAFSSNGKLKPSGSNGITFSGYKTDVRCGIWLR